MYNRQPIYSTSFSLPKVSTLEALESGFPFESVNLMKTITPTEALSASRYRARNQFIMARQHIAPLLSGSEAKQKSGMSSQIWHTRNGCFDTYFRYLALLDANYLCYYASKPHPVKANFQSYHELCLSSHSRNKVRRATQFKIHKFRWRKKAPSMEINNVVLGLHVQDILQ